MHKLILAPLLALACSAALGEWRQIVSGASATGYADANSIRRSGALASMNVLIDYPKPPFDGNNLPYRSLTMRNEYHCEEARFRVLSIASHTGQLGSGERPFKTDEAGEWEVITKTSIQRDLWKLACAKEVLPEAHANAKPPAEAGSPTAKKAP